MKPWTRFLALSLLVLAGSLTSIRAEQTQLPPQQPPMPDTLPLTLYHIQGTKTGAPAVDEAIQFLKNILAAFPQFDTFHLAHSPKLLLTAKAPQTVTTGAYITTVSIEKFVLAKDDAGKPFWKADLKITCSLATTVIHNLTVRMDPGGQHTWQREGDIFVLQEAGGK